MYKASKNIEVYYICAYGIVKRPLIIFFKYTDLVILKEWVYVRTTRATEDTLSRLGLLPRMEESPKKKRGRPRKNLS